MKINQCKTKEEVLNYLQVKYEELIETHSKQILDFPKLALIQFHNDAKDLEKKAFEQLNNLNSKNQSK